VPRSIGHRRIGEGASSHRPANGSLRRQRPPRRVHHFPLQAKNDHSTPRPSRRLLITGGAGFIGGNVVHHWTRTRPADMVVVLDALTYAGNRATIASLIEAGRVTFVHGDICDAALVASLLAEHAIDTVVHFAAESHVDRSIVDPGAFVKTNVIGTQTLLDAARRAWHVNGTWKAGVRFHHVSTDEVYGTLTPTDPAFSETTAYAPNSPYAASKAGSDHLVRDKHRGQTIGQGHNSFVVLVLYGITKCDMLCKQWLHFVQ
jgi:dTDP-glucose 4,6-dehydratase